MDHAAFQAWLDRYVGAWRSDDPAAIGDAATPPAGLCRYGTMPTRIERATVP